MSRRILCLDLATNTGYAYKIEDKIVSGSVNFAAHLKAKDRKRPAILSNASAQLNALIFQVKPHAIIYEAPFMRGAGSRLLWGLTTLVELHAYNHSVPVSELSVKTVRKDLLENGNASKDDVMQYLTDRNIKFSDNDEADAIAILLSLKH